MSERIRLTDQLEEGAVWYELYVYVRGKGVTLFISIALNLLRKIS